MAQKKLNTKLHHLSKIEGPDGPGEKEEQQQQQKQQLARSLESLSSSRGRERERQRGVEGERELRGSEAIAKEF